MHGLDWQREKWGRVAASFLHVCEWTAVNFADATIVVSRTLEDYFRGKGARNIHYIPNGNVLPGPASEDPIRRRGLEPGGYVLFVGRLVPEKGLHVLVRAHRQAVAQWPLVVAGGDGDRQRQSHGNDGAR